MFKKKCLEFNNIQTARQQCTPSRSTIITGKYDTGLQDNIEYDYQYDSIPKLPEDFETTGKIYKKNNYDITCYYGKQHLDSTFSTDRNDAPYFNTATQGSMRIYGYDKFNIFGDVYYNLREGILSDNEVFNYELPSTTIDYDYQDPINKNKYSGIIPFLKARIEDLKSYYIECHFVNPHDTNRFIQNISETPSSAMNQFPIPFIKNQSKEEGATNPYFFNDDFIYAVPLHPNLLNNYFEDNYESYKTNKFSLPFLESYELDYATDPQINSINPLFLGTYFALKYNMTISDSQEDIKNWKNLVNNYYGLIFEADSYLERLYYFFEQNNIFENTNIIIISDHGDMMSSHGLKQKQMPFKECSNVPCLIYSPDLADDLIGNSTNIYGSLVDILPTQILINNLNTSSSFDGKPLLIWKNNKLIINHKEHHSYNPINIVNSTMYNFNYFFYLQWYLSNYQGQTLTSEPSNYFQYKSSFYSIITKINQTTYKYGVYYSVNDIVSYYLFKNKNYDIFYLNELISYIKEQNIISKKTLIEYFVEQFDYVFSFEEGLNIIDSDFTLNSNNYILYVYYAFITDKLNQINNKTYLLPGSQSSWPVNSQFLSFFLYDLEEDPNEVANLFDPTKINQINLCFKNQINDIMNLSLKEKNCHELITLLPSQTYIQISNILYIFGGFISKLNQDIELEILGTLNGSNSLDSTTRTPFLESYNKYTNDKIFNCNNSNFNNPAYLFDSNKNKYYVGEIEYVKYIYDNFPYFNNLFFDFGTPDLFDTNFQTENFNLFSNLFVFQIIC